MLIAIAPSDRPALTARMKGVVHRIGREIQLARPSRCAVLDVDWVEQRTVRHNGDARLGRRDRITQSDEPFQAIHELDGEPVSWQRSAGPDPPRNRRAGIGSAAVATAITRLSAHRWRRW